MSAGLFGRKARQQKLSAQMIAITDDEMVAFIGRNHQRFLPTWTRMRESARGTGGFAWSWCWPAFLFGPAWFLYRRMYAMAALALFFPIFLALFFPLGSGNGAGGMAGALGGIGKTAYLYHAQARITKIKDRAASDEEAARKIVRAGGVSVAGGVLGGSIWLGTLVLVFAPLFAGA